MRPLTSLDRQLVLSLRTDAIEPELALHGILRQPTLSQRFEG